MPTASRIYDVMNKVSLGDDITVKLTRSFGNLAQPEPDKSVPSANFGGYVDVELDRSEVPFDTFNPGDKVRISIEKL